MPIIEALIIFVLLIIILSTLRQRLVYELSGMSLLIFGSTRLGVGLYSLLVLPGTIIHELSHWLTAEILQVRTGQITILPELHGDGEGERLGSVATERTDPLRGFLIGLAPFVTGLAMLLFLGKLLALGIDTNYAWWQILAIIYGIMVIGNSMMISKADRRTWPAVIILSALIAYLLSRAGLTISLSQHPWIADALARLNLVLGVTAGLNLVMIVGSHFIRRLIEKLTKKRIVHT